MGPFAVIGPSMKLKIGPPRFRSRSRSKIPSWSHHPRTSSSRAVWSGYCGSDSNMAFDSRDGTLSGSKPFLLGTTDRFVKKGPMATAVTEQSFEEEVIQSEKPVIVDFWAEWCGPCHAVSPVLDRIVEERGDELKLVKVNIDEQPELQQRFGIQSIPTIILFRGGEPAAAAIGAQPKPALEK